MGLGCWFRVQKISCMVYDVWYEVVQRRARVQGSWTFESLNTRLKGLLEPVSRVIWKKKKGDTRSNPASPILLSVWCVVYGVWCVVCGVWCMVYGV